MHLFNKFISLKDIFYAASICTFLIYLIIPLIFRYYDPFSTKIIFLNLIQWPPFVDFQNPESLSLEKTKNLYIYPEDNVKLGVWHTLPQKLDSIDNISNTYEYLKLNYPTILYLHGNAGTRAGWHRIMLYKILSQMNFNVISFDYRGFGDSTGFPSEENVVTDSLFIYKNLQLYTNNIILWGHSLGSGITTKLVKLIAQDKAPKPLAVILEAPFTNIADAASHHPFSRIYRYFPFFAACFLEPLRRNNLFFQSDENVKYVQSPLLIMHAEDDHVVPYDLGYKLYEIAKDVAARQDIPVEFRKFEGHFRYGHKHIHTAPDLPDIIRDFMDKYVTPQIRYKTEDSP